MAVCDAALTQFFDATVEGFHRDADRLGETRHNFSVAERNVRIRFAGSAMAHLVRPLSHLVCEPTNEPSLEILAWDGASGWRPPQPPWDFNRLSWFGELADFKSERFSVNFTADYGLLCLYDRVRKLAVYWLPDAANLPFWVMAAPFRILFHWWSHTFAGHVTHAAAVGHNGLGVLLVGRGGSGKSTTAVCCVDAGMQYVSDDYVLLTRNPIPMAHSLYHSAKIHTPFLNAALPHWKDRVVTEIGPERKSLAFVNECLAQQVRSQLTICGVVQPRVAGLEEAKLVPLAPSLGLLGLAASTMYQLPEARQTTLSFFAKWMRNVPTYELQLSPDLTSAPRTLSQFLSEEGARRAA